jgi:AraC family transcriptional regulator of adaptative response/methylated-DNA-[protein]-cysteine methyltransferase
MTTATATTTATPSAPRARRASAGSIVYGVGASSLGHVLVARSGAGLAAILLGDDADAVRAALRERFPRVELVEGDGALRETLASVLGCIERPSTIATTSLELAPRGTAFQQRVWRALREVPVGTTVSYAQLAGRVGAPAAVRAVAQACAANPLAVVVPCHRVVRSDGALSGYRWGVERKRALLDREAAR